MHKKNKEKDAMNVKGSKESVKSQKGERRVEMILKTVLMYAILKKRTAN